MSDLETVPPEKNTPTPTSTGNETRTAPDAVSTPATATDEGKGSHGSQAPQPSRGRFYFRQVMRLVAIAAILSFIAYDAYTWISGWLVKERPIPYHATPAVTSSEGQVNANGELLPTASKETTPFVIIRVTEGQTSLDVAQSLRDLGFELPNWLMKLAARVHPNQLDRLHKGRYKISTDITPAALLDTLGKGAMMEGSIRIPDGATIWEVRSLFNNAQGLQHLSKDLTDEALAKALGLNEPTPEGFLAPDTYRYAEGVTDLAVMKLAVKRQKTLLDKAWANRPQTLTTLKNPYEALILASIVEKESGLAEDRTKIASVFHNRLTKKMPLQTDPTVIYGLGPNWNGKITKKDLQGETPYNTYVIEALPPTPIGMPGAAAIEATLNPATTDYLYFVSRGDGTSEFSKTLNAHNRAVYRFILRPQKKTASPQASADD